jgi:hypothetical protein
LLFSTALDPLRHFRTFKVFAKRDIAIGGLMACAYDDCMVTGEVQKAKYVYYRCTGHRGKCNLPRFREEEIANRLGEPLKGLQVPPEIVSRIVTTLREDQRQAVGKVSAERTRLESRLTGVRNRMDAAYADKLDGKIPEEFWETQDERLADGRAASQNGDSGSDQCRNRRPRLGCAKDFRTRE